MGHGSSHQTAHSRDHGKTATGELPEAKRKSIISLPEDRNHAFKTAARDQPSPGRRSNTPRQSIVIPPLSTPDTKKPLNRSTTANHLNSLVAVWQAKANLTATADLIKTSTTIFPNTVWFHIFRFCSLSQLTALMRCNKAMFILGYHAYNYVSKRLHVSSTSTVTIPAEPRIRCTLCDLAWDLFMLIFYFSVSNSCDAEFLTNGSIVLLTNQSDQIGWNIYDYRWARKNKVWMPILFDFYYHISN